VNPMRRVPRAIAAARAVNASFFLAVASYCFLSYTPFAYVQFIKPNVLPALTDFVKLTPWLFWLVLLITLLTLMETLRGGRGSTAARVYTAAMMAVGAALMLRPPLASIGNTPRAFFAGLLALVPPVWLAIVDHRIWPPPEIRPADPYRALAAASYRRWPPGGCTPSPFRCGSHRRSESIWPPASSHSVSSRRSWRICSSSWCSSSRSQRSWRWRGSQVG